MITVKVDIGGADAQIEVRGGRQETVRFGSEGGLLDPNAYLGS